MSNIEPERITPYDLRDVRGQYGARRALEIAAAGGHGLLLIGPPTSTKTMLAIRLPGLLPEIRYGTPCTLRAPHPSISVTAMIGRPDADDPGEIGQAHAGVLLLADAPRFGRDVLEALREPLEIGSITPYTCNGHRTLPRPAKFQFVATMTPHPREDPDPDPDADTEMGRHATRDTERHRERVARYLGPYLEIVARTKTIDPREYHPGEPTRTVRERVLKARTRRAKRIERTGRDDDLDESASRMVREGAHRMGLVEGRENVVRRIARTIADLDGSTRTTLCHVAEALSYQQGPATANWTIADAR